MDWKEVKQWLDEHNKDEEVVSYLEDISKTWIKSEDGKEFLLTSEGKILYQSEVDRRVTSGIDTFKEKTMPEIINESVTEKMKKLNPEETPDQKRIRELEETQTKRDKELKNERLENFALKTITKKKLPELEPLIKTLIGDDEEGTLANIEKAELAIKSIVDKELEENLPGRKITPSDPKIKTDKVNPWKKETFNLTLQGKIFKEDPEKAARLKREAGIKE